MVAGDDARDDGAGPAQASPAPLTQEQVYALAGGIADGGEIARSLESHSPSAKAPRPTGRRKRSPVRITADELAALKDRGRTPKTVADQLKDAERKDAGAVGEEVEKEAPSQQPRAARSSG